jgi:hypothetical protein
MQEKVDSQKQLIMVLLWLHNVKFQKKPTPTPPRRGLTGTPGTKILLLGGVGVRSFNIVEVVNL